MQQHVEGAEQLGLAIQAARHKAGLTQGDLAERLGVSRVTIGRLEHGEDVSMKTALAALSACGMGLTPVESRGWFTAYEHARAIGGELDRDDYTFALRLLRQALEDLDYLIEASDESALQTFLAREPAIGDARWDQFLRVALADRCEQAGLPIPSWTRSAPLSEPFFPARPSRRFIARTIEQTKASFATANIWIDARDLAYA